MSSRQDWRTVPSIFAQLNRDFGPFDLDCAADDQNHLCDRYWTAEQGSLVQSWAVDELKAWFVNIPFGDPLPWVKKAIREANDGHGGIMLCLAGLSTEWFQLAWSRATLLIPDRRIMYWHPGENPHGRGFDRDSVIFIFHRTPPGTNPIAYHTLPYKIPPHGDEVRRLLTEANGQQRLPGAA